MANNKKHNGPLCLFIVLAALLQNTEEIQNTGAVEVEEFAGDNVVLKPQYSGEPSEITWRKGTRKVLLLELSPQEDITYYPPLQSRVTIDRTNGALTIRDLTIEDIGVYEAEVLVNSIPQYTRINLIVHDCPAKPIITDHSPEDRITLLCKSSTPGVTYEWFNQTGSVDRNRFYSEPRSNKDVNLTCVVNNEVCKKNTSIIIRYTPDCPAKPIITDYSTEGEIILDCKSSTLDVTYEWFNQTGSVGKNRLYIELRPNKDVTLTCVVNNEVCKKNTSITILYTSAQQPKVKLVGSEVTMVPKYTGNPTEINWKKDNELVDKLYNLKDRVTIDRTNGTLTIKDLTVGDSGLYKAEVLGNNSTQYTEIRLTVRENKMEGEDDALEPQYIGDPSEIIWTVNGDILVEMSLKPQVEIVVYHLQGTVTISDTDERLTIRDLIVEDSEMYSVEMTASAQQPEVKLVGSEVTMEPKYTGNPTEINWKKDGNKLVDMELNTPDEPIFYRLLDRATIDRTNGRLTIRDLTIGDSGLYRAEVLVNSVYRYTNVTLAVRDCPDVPTITDHSTEDRIALLCESSTPGVTYEWRINKISVDTDQLYVKPRTKEDVTVTCFVENEVCKKNVSITILYTPESSGSSVGNSLPRPRVFGIPVAIAIVILIMVLCYQFRHNPHVRLIYNRVTCGRGRRSQRVQRGSNPPCVSNTYSTQKMELSLLNKRSSDMALLGP